MLPSFQCNVTSSPNSLDLMIPLPRKNGLHKQTDKATNGKRSNGDVTSIHKLFSPEGLSEQQCNNFLLDTENLINILTRDSKRLEAVSKFVKDYNDVTIHFSNYDSLRLCDLNGTPYMGQKYMQESWEELYLPKKTRMQVFGMLENTQVILPTENTQVILPTVPWIILVGENGCIYAYGEEELYLIARSLRDFVYNGKRKMIETFYYPESGDEEDECLQQDKEIQEIRNRTKEFVNKSADEFDEFLSFLSSK